MHDVRGKAGSLERGVQGVGVFVDVVFKDQWGGHQYEWKPNGEASRVAALAVRGYGRDDHLSQPYKKSHRSQEPDASLTLSCID